MDDRSRRRFLIEDLEDRCVPASFHWTTLGNGNFSDAANWRDQFNVAGVPTVGDNVTINVSNVQVAVAGAISVNSIFMGNNSSLSFAAGSSLTLTNSLIDSVISNFALPTTASINVAGGNAELDGAATIGGTINSAASTSVEFASGTLNFNSGATLTGAGNFTVTNATLNLNTNLAIPANFELGGGTVTGSGNLTVSSTTVNWTGGTLTGTGTTTINAGAILNISGGATKTLNGRTLTINGTANWTGNGVIAVLNDAVINNAGTFNCSSDSTIYRVIGAATFNNSGALTKTSPVGTGVTVVEATFNNTGTMTVTTGQFDVQAGGTDTGAFAVAAGQKLLFSTSGTNTLNSGATFTGAGLVEVAQGVIVNINANLSMPNLLVSAGELTGGSNLTATSSFSWTGGYLTGVGSTIVAAGATLNISGGAAKTLDARTLVNNGTAVWTGNGNIAVKNDCKINNGGSFANDSDSIMNLVIGTATFNNTGSFVKTSPVGTGITTLQINYVNSGTTTVTTGELDFDRGGTTTGTFSVAAGQKLRFLNGGTTNLNTGAALTGSGTYDVASGATVNANANLGLASLTVSGGTLSGTGNLTITNGFTWTGGTLSGTGTTTINAGATMTISGNSKTLDTRKITNSGTLNWIGTGTISSGNGAVVTNNGTFNASGDAFFDNLFGAAATIVNTGTFNKSSVASNGVTEFDADFANNGVVTVQSGVLKFDRNASMNNGTFSVSAGATLQVVGGLTIPAGSTLQGGGTAIGNIVNNGNVNPGTSPGSLTINGNFTNASTGVVNIEIGGDSPVTQYDVLSISGTATLGGRLNISVINAFAPALGSTFQIIAYSQVSGAFKSVTGLNIGGGKAFARQVGATQVKLITSTSGGFDIVGRNQANGAWNVAQSNGSSFATTAWTVWSPPPGVEWLDVVTGDFNGDGRSDIAGRIKATGEWYVSLSNAFNTFTTSQWTVWSSNTTWLDVRVGDFNGDGWDDICGREQATGAWYVAKSNGQASFSTSAWGTWSTGVQWSDVKIGDFNGDGRQDIVGRLNSTGEWYVARSGGANFSNVRYASWSPLANWTDVQVGDFNNDGFTDIAGRTQVGGYQWWVGLSNGSLFNTAYWTSWAATVSWVDVRAADFNGDGRTDIVARLQDNGQLWVGTSTGNSFAMGLWAGISTGITWADVVVGDFNGDGRADIAQRYKEAGQWWVGTSTGNNSFSLALWGTWAANVTWVDVAAANVG